MLLIRHSGLAFPTNSNITGMNTFLLNGVITTFGAANMALLSLIGQDFTFAATKDSQASTSAA